VDLGFDPVVHAGIGLARQLQGKGLSHGSGVYHGLGPAPSPNRAIAFRIGRWTREKINDLTACPANVSMAIRRNWAIGVAFPAACLHGLQLSRGSGDGMKHLVS
jgi:hypothetical protein